MTPSPPPSRDANPFATCWTRPGALPWIEDESPTLAEVVARLEAAAWRGQVTGPHGSGKSALLRALEGPLRVSGREPTVVTAGATHPKERGVVLLVEGFELLPPAKQRAQLRRWREEGSSYVVTTHAPLGEVPVVAALQPSETLVAALFERLTAERATPVALDDAVRSWRRRRGNLRDVWFDLYDLHEKLVRPERTHGLVRTYTTPGVQR